MAYAYTPSLTVTPYTVIRRTRQLPVRGAILVTPGQTVRAEDIVAEAELPGEVRPLDVAGHLGISPDEVPGAILKRTGQRVAQDEPLARTRGLWGRFAREYRSPIAGTIESVSAVTGQAVLRGDPVPLHRRAYAAGTVVEVCADEAVTIEITGALIQGIFGVGGEATGRLALAVQTPEDVLDADSLQEKHAGTIVVGGSLVTAAAIKRAAAVGVRGIITGGLDDSDLRDLLGYDLGVASTGDEPIAVTVVVTEGFGRIPMAAGTFQLLRRLAGRLASINGATQIRAGVIRPEVIVPLTEAASPESPREHGGATLQIGARLRAVREPYFGRLGTCIGLPVDPVTLASEARVRVVDLQFDDGERASVPRANVELIQA